MSASNLQLVKELIQQGQTQKAVDILVENQNSFPAPFRKQISQLSNRFYTLEKQRQSHKITFDAYQTYSVDLIEHILDTVEILETKAPQKDKDVPIPQQRQRKRLNWMTIVSIVIMLLCLTWLIKTIILPSEVIIQLDFFEVKSDSSLASDSQPTKDEKPKSIDNTTKPNNPSQLNPTETTSLPPKPTSIFPKMVFVKGGTYNRDGKIFEIKDFYIAEHETTRGEWYSIMHSGEEPPRSFRPSIPKTGISYKDILKFLELLEKREGKAFRLPSEVEWEFAARSGTKSIPYPDKHTSLNDCAWSNENSNDLMPVSQKRPNSLGIYDLLGNAAEIVEDCSQQVQTSNCTYKIVKGGSWQNINSHVSINSRSRYNKNDPSSAYGFRVVYSY